jgi:hypothetical protein
MKKVPHFLKHLQKRLLMPFSVFTMIVVLSLTIFYSCRQENDIVNVSESNNIKTEARAFYENALVELRNRNFDASKSTAHFNALSFTLDWDKAMQHNKESLTYLEVPVKFANNSSLALSSAEVGSKFDKQNNVEVPVRLIIKKFKSGEFDAQFMMIESSKPYGGEVPDFNLLKKIDNFTGREYLFNLDGTFYKAWRHERGQKVSELVLGSDNYNETNSNKPLNVRACYFLVLTYGDEIIAILDRYCFPPEVHDGGGNGGPDPKPWGSDGGGDTNNPPPRYRCLVPNSITLGQPVNNGTIIFRETGFTEVIAVTTRGDIRMGNIVLRVSEPNNMVSPPTPQQIQNLIATAFNNAINNYTGTMVDVNNMPPGFMGFTAGPGFAGQWNTEFANLSSALWGTNSYTEQDGTVVTRPNVNLSVQAHSGSGGNSITSCP